MCDDLPGYECEGQDLRVFVRQLRKKLQDDSTDPRWIPTEPRIGYRWLAENQIGPLRPTGPELDLQVPELGLHVTRRAH